MADAASEVAAALRVHPAFARASAATLRDVARASTLTHVDARAVLLRAGTRAAHLLLVVEGALELSHPIAGKRGKSVLLGRIEAPTLFGDATLVGSSGVWPVSGRAAVDALVVRIPPRALEAALDTDALLAAELYRAACRRHFRSICFRRDLVLHGTAGQLLGLLATPPPPGATWTPTRLARSLGIDRTTVWRHLARLKREGLVTGDRDEPLLALE